MTKEKRAMKHQLTVFELRQILNHTMEIYPPDYEKPELLLVRASPDTCKELLHLAQTGQVSDKYIWYLQRLGLI